MVRANKFFKTSIELNWNFRRGAGRDGGGGGQTKKTLHGGGMDIFWNHIISVNTKRLRSSQARD